MQITTYYKSSMQKSISEHNPPNLQVDRLQQQKSNKSNKVLTECTPTLTHVFVHTPGQWTWLPGQRTLERGRRTKAPSSCPPCSASGSLPHLEEQGRVCVWDSLVRYSLSSSAHRSTRITRVWVALVHFQQ